MGLDPAYQVAVICGDRSLEQYQTLWEIWLAIDDAATQDGLLVLHYSLVVSPLKTIWRCKGIWGRNTERRFLQVCITLKILTKHEVTTTLSCHELASVFSNSRTLALCVQCEAIECICYTRDYIKTLRTQRKRLKTLNFNMGKLLVASHLWGRLALLEARSLSSRLGRCPCRTALLWIQSQSTKLQDSEPQLLATYMFLSYSELDTTKAMLLNSTTGDTLSC